ncbi:MAG: protein phosphatase 2C domain-containing protein [Deltaproteobacteria bacterium]|nr:protein phosphatase 2C domain-containing protein [Deltaproteobacteria bacterium]
MTAPASSPQGSGPPGVAVVAAGRTDVGRERNHNEDRLLTYPALDLFVVADGMGGHHAGEVASALCAKSLENYFRASRHGNADAALLEDPRPLDAEARRLLGAVRKANTDVFQISRASGKHRGMGTTVVAAHVARATGLLHVAHVGDSRCYRLRRGVFTALTRDHSLVGEAQLLKPDITPEELAMLPKNVISRAIGRGARVEIDVRSEPVEVGDTYLLCSDGLCGPVEDPDIRAILLRETEPRAACQALVDAANAAGGPDNITAIVIQIVAAEGGVAAPEDDDFAGFAEAHRRCTACREIISEVARFCGHCGTMLEE